MYRCLQSLILITIFTPVVSQQVFTENRMKAEYAFLYSTYVEWPDSIINEKYEFGVLGSDEIFNELNFKSLTEKI